MSKKKSNTRGNGPAPRRWTFIAVAVGLGILLLGGAALVGPVLKGGKATSQPAGARAPVPRSLATFLPPPAPGTRTPINDTDPVTGKPLTPTSPVLAYKGYQIGFCCDKSAGYTGGWERMSESQRDAFVRKYLK